MSAIQQALAGIGGASAVAISSLFKVNTRTGTGSAGSVTSALFTPDLVISKGRSGTTGWNWVTSAEGTGKYFDSSGTSGLVTDAQTVTALNSNGFSFGTASRINTNTATYMDLMFKKAIGFLDIGTVTLNGTSSQTINHSLGVSPGLIVLFDTASTTDTIAYHQSLASSSTFIKLNTTASSVNTGTFIFNSISSTNFVIDPANMAGWLGGSGSSSDAIQWIAFAHDTSASSKIYCGSYVGNGSATGPTVTLPFQPQFLLVKRTTVGGDNWVLLDSTRSSANPRALALFPNTAGAESSGSWNVDFNSTGFQIKTNDSSLNNSGSDTYIYMAINSI